MVKTPLVEGEIDAGRRLVQALDQAGFPITAALWSYLPDGDEWRLVLASPKVRDEGAIAAYMVIDEALQSSHINFPQRNISAVAPGDPLILELRLFAGTEPAPFIGGSLLDATVIGGAYIEGAYVYRAERILGKSGIVNMWSVSRDKSKKQWIARPCAITFEEGLFKKIDVEGFDVPQKLGAKGINARFNVLADFEKRRNGFYGNVTRLNFRGGRLESSDTVARWVRVEGFHDTPVAATI